MLLREIRQSDIDFLKNHSINRSSGMKIQQQIDVRIAIEENGICLAIGGLQTVNDTTAWCWLDMSDEAGKYIIIVYRIIKTWLDEMVVKMGIKRLQAYVEVDYEEGHRMVKHLGFNFEKTMPCFIGDKSADLYSRIT
jgi:hypothetical protein